jgi:hypothetical protein
MPGGNKRLVKSIADLFLREERLDSHANTETRQKRRRSLIMIAVMRDNRLIKRTAFR